MNNLNNKHHDVFWKTIVKLLVGVLIYVPSMKGEGASINTLYVPRSASMIKNYNPNYNKSYLLQ